MNRPTLAKITFFSGTILCLILLLAIVRRVYGFDRLGLWSDELWVVMESTRGSLWEMLTYVYYNDNHPPGYYLVLRYTQFFLGSSDDAVRAPSFISGIFLVYLTFVAGKRFYSIEAGLIAAALVSGSYNAIFYSQEARANILFALSSFIAFYYFSNLVIENNISMRRYVCFWTAAVVSFYLHYAGAVFIGCIFLFYVQMLLIKRTKEFFIIGLWIFSPVVLICSPWFPGVYHHLMHSPTEGWMEGAVDSQVVFKTFSDLLGPDALRFCFYKIILFLTVSFLVFDLIKKNITKQSVLSIFILQLIFLPVAIFYIKSVTSQPAFADRHFLSIMPLFAILAGYVSLRLSEIANARFKPSARLKNYILFAFLVVIMIVNTWGNMKMGLYSWPLGKEEYREAVDVVVNDKYFLSGHETIAIVATNDFFEHYLQRDHLDALPLFIFFETARGDALHHFILDKKVTEFYYLEHHSFRHYGKNTITENAQFLIDHYKPICRQQFFYAQAIKFSVVVEGNNQMGSAAYDEIPHCLVNDPAHQVRSAPSESVATP